MINTKQKTNIWLMGGLGNQLFQLNKAHELRLSGIDVTLIDNLLDPKSLITSKFLRWKIHDNILHKIYRHNIPIKSTRNLFPLATAKLPFLNNYSKFNRQRYDTRSATHLFGYFQDSITVNLKPNHFKFFTKTSDDTVMHLRLTDNNNLQYSKGYYGRILSALNKKVIKIVSDDKATASEIINTFSKAKCEIITKDAIIDFQTLAQSKTLICAPSTYSFWAALANDKAHEIYVPKIFKRYLKSSPENWIYV